MELYVYAKCMSPTATNTLGTVGKSLDHLQKYCWGWEGLNDERMRQYGERVNIAVVKKKVLVGCSLSFHSFFCVLVVKVVLAQRNGLLWRQRLHQDSRPHEGRRGHRRDQRSEHPEGPH